MTAPRVELGAGAEFDIIRRILVQADASGDAAGGAVVLGPGDDCAVLDGGLCISVDMSIEDVHFRRAWLSLEQIGYRAAAAALSDLAAMAAAPIGVLAAIGCPADTDDVLRIMDGIGAAARDAGAALLGGDLARSPGPVVIDIVVVGTADRPVLRSGARAGDDVWVTGRLGAAAAAVREWSTGRVPDDAAVLAFTRPVPRIAAARWLAGRGLTSALIDLSDGLAGDAGHIAAASGVQLVLDADQVPIHDAARAAAADDDDALRLALHGGEDYELCFTAAAATLDGALATAFTEQFGIELTRIGVVRTGSGVMLRGAGGDVTSTDGGYDHFRRKTP
jgi:thiamine-monophosphate kinase